MESIEPENNMKRSNKIKKLKIGSVTLPNNLILGPMAGVTDLPFRLLCKEQGAGLLCMEMVSAKAILYKNKNTESLLEENSIYVAGKKDMPMYFEKDGKKIAIVSTNSVIIGTKENYTKNGISVYDEDNIKKNIQEAKKMADFVIVDIHWGKGEASFGVTTQMEEMAKFVIESGADLVMGTHAIGIQPISTYNGKPIIYTTGYAMTDLEYETTKVSYLFDLKFENTKLSSIEMTPIYIKDSKEVLLYKDYDEVAANINMKSICSRTQDNGLNAGISDNKIIVKF